MSGHLPRSGISLPAGLSAEGDQTWHGTGPLWIDLGNFAAPVPRQDGTLRVKHAWWTGDVTGAPVSVHGPPTVTAHPLNGGETVEATVGGYATTGSGEQTFAWWPTVLEFPAAGCWEITGEWEGSTLTAVVLLADAAETEG